MLKTLALALSLLFISAPVFAGERDRVNRRESRHEWRDNRHEIRQDRREMRREPHIARRYHREEPSRFHRNYEYPRDYRRYYGREHRFNYRHNYWRDRRFYWGRHWFVVLDPYPRTWHENDDYYVDYDGYNWHLYNARTRSGILIIID